MSPGASADEPQELAGRDRELLRAEASLAFNYQRLDWDVFRSGISLGVEEIQEQRIAASESPVEADLTEAAVLFLFTAVLESPIAAIVVEKAIRSALVARLYGQLKIQSLVYGSIEQLELSVSKGALAKAEQAAKSTAERATRRGLAATEKPSIGRVERASAAKRRADAAQKELAKIQAQVDRNKWTLLSKTVDALKGIREKEGPEYVVAVAKGMAATDMFRSTPSPSTPAVNIRSQVEAQALSFIRETYFQQTVIDLRLADPNLLIDEAQAIYRDLPKFDDYDMGLVLEYYRYCTAALVWAEIFGLGRVREDRKQQRRLKERDLARNSTLNREMPSGADIRLYLFDQGKRHAKYLVGRFGTGAHKWASLNPDQVQTTTLFATDQAAAVSHYLNLALKDESYGVDLVIQYLEAMHGEFPDLLRIRRT